MQLTIIIPAYNEEKSIGEVIQAIHDAADFPYELLIIDDCSTDRTAEIAERYDAIPNLLIKILKHKVNRGYSASLKTGLKAAKGEYVLICDADGTYPPESIPELVKHMYDYDMVVGQRSWNNVPLVRRPAKWMINLLADYLVGKHIPDVNSGLRVFKKDLAMEFYHLYPQRFSFTTTITLAFMTNGYTVKYIPIDYKKRKTKSTVKPTDFMDFIQLIIRVITYFNPLKIFTTIAAFLLLLALAIFLYSYLVLSNIMDVTVVVISLSALQVFLTGLIADLIVKSR